MFLIGGRQAVQQRILRKEILGRICIFPDRYTSVVGGSAMTVPGIYPMDRVVFDIGAFGYFCHMCEVDPQIVYTGRVTSINLTRAAIRDADLRILSEIPELEVLDLCDTPITDAALDIVQTLPNLQRVNVCHTAVSLAAVIRLKKARPELLIAHGFDAHVTSGTPEAAPHSSPRDSSAR
jgi:hypothetical protein